MRRRKRKPTAAEEEIEKMLKKIYQMKDDIQEKLQKVYTLSGMTEKEAEKFIENPGNFTEKQWKWMEAKRERIREKIRRSLRGVTNQKQESAKKEKKDTKSRKGKTLGGRKGWMRM